MISIQPCLIQGLVGLLIQQLGDAHYWKRHTATKALQPMIYLAAPQLEQAIKHPDAEIALRASRLYAPIHERNMEKAAFEMRPKMPWLSLPCAYEIQYWVDRAQKQYGAPGGGPDWLNYRVATKLYTKQLLLLGKSREEIHVLLDFMEQTELEWTRRYQPQEARR